MPYQGHDTDQNLLCQFTAHPNHRRSESLDRKGAFRAYILVRFSYSECQDVSSTALTHLLYSKFASVSVQVSPLLSEMERRASSYPDELLSLLAECHTAYLTARRTLLGPQITHEVKGMDPAHSELVELVG